MKENKVFRRNDEGEPVGLLVVVSYFLTYGGLLALCYFAYQLSWALFFVIVVLYSVWWYESYHWVANFLCRPDHAASLADDKTASMCKSGGSTAAVDLVGKAGRSRTALHPGGQILIDQTLFHAITEGEFVEADKPVTVVAVQGSTLIVQENR